MDEKLHNRRLIVGAGLAVILAYAVVRHFESHSGHHGWIWTHDEAKSDDAKDDGDQADNAATGNTAAQLTLNNKDGSVGIKIPGFSADVRVPGMNLDKGNFDVDGIKLYPGSKIGQMNVNGSTKSDEDSDSHGNVALDFDAPAPPATVRAYYVDALKAHGYTIAPESTINKMIATKGDNDSHFEVSFAPVGTNATHGALAVSGND